jgi:hypothetical protein
MYAPEFCEGWSVLPQPSPHTLELYQYQDWDIDTLTPDACEPRTSYTNITQTSYEHHMYITRTSYERQDRRDGALSYTAKCVQNRTLDSEIGGINTNNGAVSTSLFEPKTYSVCHRTQQSRRSIEREGQELI